MNHTPDITTGLFAVGTLLATDDLVADELMARGLTVRGRALGWVTAEGSVRDAYEAMLWSRVGDRVVWVLDHRETPTAEAFRDLVSSIDWNHWLYPGHSVRVDVSGKMHWVKDTRFAGQLVMDGIRDQAVAAARPRPVYESATPDCRVAVRFGRGFAHIGITLNRTPLNQRGYRTEGGVAPIRETLAQVMLSRLRVAESEPATLIDPCCGSGTLLIEAAMRLAQMAPQRARTADQLSRWRGLESIAWTALVAEAKSLEQPVSCRLIGRDLDVEAVAIARANIARAGLSEVIEIEAADCRDLDWNPAQNPSPGWILTNPPYGMRLGRHDDLAELYYELGERCKGFPPDWRLGVVSSEPTLIASMALRADKKWTLQAGGQQLTIAGFALSRPEPKAEEQAAPAPVLALLNRIDKNLAKRRTLLKHNQVDCYRIYDADLPEFNVAIDRYADFLHIQEYRPPKTVDAARALERSQWIRYWVPKHLGIPIKQAVYKERFRQQGSTQYEKRDEQLWIDVQENGLCFEVNLTTYTDVGLFLDHRPLRRWLRERSQGLRVLNLFCYTGTLSVAAAMGRARHVVSVDASKTYLAWAERNFELNGLNPRHYVFERANILQWLRVNPSPQFDLIILDPPTFSNTKGVEETLDIQRDHVRLLDAVAAWLAPGGCIYFSNNAQGFRLDPQVSERFVVEDVTKQSIDPDFDRGLPHVLFKLSVA